LVDGLPSAYQNDANRWWVAKEEAAGRIVAPDPWPSSMLRSVKAAWMVEQVNSMVHTKRFSMYRPDGRPASFRSPWPREQMTYTATKEKARNGQGGPPMVEEEVLVRRMVPWTPEIGATGRRHVAGIKFLDEARRIQALGAKATKHDLEEALVLAFEALSVETPS
jgi:hypothetical protein